jgi:SAM-dependent methyltransferase
VGDAADPRLRDEQGWDGYWDGGKTRAGGLLYDAIASFYRKWIIRPALNRFVRRYFTPGARLLHAGCGGGQVDVDIHREVAITGLDISLNALRLYKKVNRGHGQTLHGSIFEIPLPDGSLDGVYNLGVMEHFTEEEIARILHEFHRVLRPEGRVLVFWPPEFGLSVLFFKGLVWVFRNVLRRKDVKFHPGEITRVRSRRHVTCLFESGGFRVIRYSFGPRDLFTYAVVAAERQ